MRVQRVVLPEDQGVSWTVLGAEHGPIAPIESWLSHLSNVGRSPNTQKAYATDLKDYFQFLDQQQIDWRAPSLEVIGEWTAWLRSPTDPAKTVVALHPRQPRCGPATVSRKLSAVSARSMSSTPGTDWTSAGWSRCGRHGTGGAPVVRGSHS